MTAWRQVKSHKGGRTRFAAGFAAGVLIATLPLYGIQTLLGLIVARRFRLHPVSVVAGANVSIPPIGPLLIFGGISVGHLILHGSFPPLGHYDVLHGNVLGTLLIEWGLGGLVLGTILALVSFVGLNSLLRLVSDVPADPG